MIYLICILYEPGDLKLAVVVWEKSEGRYNINLAFSTAIQDGQ